MAITLKDIHKTLSEIIVALTDIEKKDRDPDNRLKIGTQVDSLSTVAGIIHAMSSRDSGDEVKVSKENLDEITLDLKKEKKKLEDIAVKIHKLAQAAALAEKVVKMAAGII